MLAELAAMTDNVVKCYTSGSITLEELRCLLLTVMGEEDASLLLEVVQTEARLRRATTTGDHHGRS